MFSDVNFDAYSFESNWKKHYPTNEFKTQTDTYKIVHRGLNIKKYRSNECQTDSYLYTEEDIHADIDESELKDFIKKVTPRIYKALSNNMHTNLFKYSTVNRNIKESSCLYKIENKKDELAARNISQLSWNCNGSVVAAAFGDIIHNQWCLHTNTGVGIFRLSNRNKSPLENKPDVFLETTTCACCVKFHYDNKSLIAAGTHNGEIIVWDRSRSESELIVATNSENKVHEEPINSILWLNEKNKTMSNNLRLISLGFDGTIVIWNLSMRKSILAPLNCYLLTARDLPKSIRYRGSLSKGLHLLCGSLNPFDSEYLVAGIDIGVLFHCQIKSKSTSSVANEVKEIKSPVESVLATISGAVHAVQWSKVIPNFLAAVAANGIIYIFNVEYKQQISVIDPGQGYLYDLSLSLLMPGLVATSGENSTVVITNFLDFSGELEDLYQNSNHVNSKSEILKLDSIGTGEDSNIINCVEFNDNNAEYLAASDINGTLYIWQLSEHLTESNQKNRVNFENIFNSFKKSK